MLVLPLLWVHFVVAYAICVSCPLFLHKVFYIIKILKNARTKSLLFYNCISEQMKCVEIYFCEFVRNSCIP